MCSRCTSARWRPSDPFILVIPDEWPPCWRNGPSACRNYGGGCNYRRSRWLRPARKMILDLCQGPHIHVHTSAVTAALAAQRTLAGSGLPAGDPVLGSAGIGGGRTRSSAGTPHPG